MSRIFVTGGMGFLGSHVIRNLLEKEHTVLAYDSFMQYIHPSHYLPFATPYCRLLDVLDQIEVVRGSTLDTVLLRDTLHRFSPNYVIHLAAVPLPRISMECPEEAFGAIVAGTNNLLMCMKDLASLARVVHISSSMVYGDFIYAPADEEHPQKPRELYGAYKYCSETITRAFCLLHAIDFVILRPTAIYGPWDGNERVLATFLRNALSGEPIVVKGADLQYDFTFVSDVAEGITRAAFTPQASGQVFNISRGEGHSLVEVAEIVAALVPGTRIEYQERDQRLPKRGALDISKARALIGYAPRFDVEAGLARYHRFMLEHIHDTYSLLGTRPAVQGAPRRDHEPHRDNLLQRQSFAGRVGS